MLGVGLEFLFPGGLVDAGDGLELLGAEGQAGPVQFAVGRSDAEHGLLALGLAFDAVDHPLQHAHVLAVTRPHELAVGVLAEPVDAEDRGQRVALLFQFLFHVQPVLEIVAHVVAAERQHGEGIAAHHALRAKGGSGGFGAHGGSHVDAFGPVAGFGHQRHGGGAAAAEHHGVDRHAFSVVPLGVQRRVVGGSHGEARVGVGSLAAGLAVFGRPVLALPVDQVRGQLAAVVLFHAFPPHVAIVGQCDVGEDDVVIEALHAVGVGVQVGARSHAEVTRLGVDGVQVTVVVRLDPGDVVTDGGDFPAFETGRRHQHGEVGLAAGAREGGRHVVLLALGVGHAQDQHVLGQPALVTAHGGGDAQGQALLAQQRVAAIAGAVGPDFARFGEVHDVFHIGVAGPAGLVLLACSQGSAHGVHAGNELAIGTQHVEHGLAHAGHQLLVHYHIGAVGQFDADVGDVAAQRTHAEGHHIHGAALHAAVEQRVERGAHLGRVHPVVGRAGVFLFRAADVGAVFDTGHVGRIGPGQIAARTLGRIQLLERACIHQLLAQAVVLFLAAVAPHHLLGFAQRSHFGHPGDEARMLDIVRNVQIQPGGGCGHQRTPIGIRNGATGPSSADFGKAGAGHACGRTKLAQDPFWTGPPAFPGSLENSTNDHEMPVKIGIRNTLFNLP